MYMFWKALASVVVKHLIIEWRSLKNVFNIDNRLMHKVLQNVPGHSAMLLICTKLPFVFRTFVLSILRGHL